MTGVFSSPKWCTRPRNRAERRIGPEQILCGDPPHGEDDARLDEQDLPLEVRQAARDLLGLGIAVTGRTRLEDVRDVDVLAARQSDGAQHRIQQLSRPAHEGLALTVLLGSRCFTDDEPLRMNVADAEDRLGAARMQGAFATRCDLRR